jgi:hypothetical protein
MTRIVDQYSDPAFAGMVQQLARMPQLEAFVKEASIEPGEDQALPDTAFAWPDQRKFPIHTPEHAALSQMYAKLASHVPGEVQDAIKTALEVFGVPETVFAEQVKVAAARDDEYLVPALKLFPVRDAADVKYAEQQLLEQISKLDLDTRVQACGNLVKKAAEFKAPLHPEMQKLAGFVVSSTQELRTWLDARASALTPTHHMEKAAYEKLSSELARQPAESRDREGLLKVADVIATLDERTGLDKHYDRRLPDPMRTVFNTSKLAADTVDLAGTMVPVAKLAQLPMTFWQDLGGDELRDEIFPGGSLDRSKLAMIVETLPLDLKLTLEAYTRG